MEPTEVRLSDVVSDGIEAARAALTDGKLTAEQVVLPPSGLHRPTPGPSYVPEILDSLLGRASEHTWARALHAIAWLHQHQIPWVSGPRYVLETGKPVASRATLGAVDGTLMVEVGRVAGWKVERAAEGLYSLLLVPHGPDQPLALLLTPTHPVDHPPQSKPAPFGDEALVPTAEVLATASRLVSCYPELTFWQDEALRYQLVLRLAVKLGLRTLEAQLP